MYIGPSSIVINAYQIIQKHNTDMYGNDFNLID